MSGYDEIIGMQGRADVGKEGSESIDFDTGYVYMAANPKWQACCRYTILLAHIPYIIVELCSSLSFPNQSKVSSPTISKS